MKITFDVKTPEDGAKLIKCVASHIAQQPLTDSAKDAPSKLPEYKELQEPAPYQDAHRAVAHSEGMRRMYDKIKSGNFG